MKIINKTQALRILKKDENRAKQPGKKFRYYETSIQPTIGLPFPVLVRFSSRSRKKNQMFAILSSK